MRQIYKQAQQVLICLGDTSIGERIVLQSLAHTLQAVISHGNESVEYRAQIWARKRELRKRISQVVSGEWDFCALGCGRTCSTT